MNILSACPSCGLIFPLAFVPSLVWLFFFWVQDKHREPKRAIISVFLWGFFVAVPVLLLELLAQYTLFPLVKGTGIEWIFGFAGIAFIEEGAKYLVVRNKALPGDDLDEPQDAMLYMMTAALGFAAIENFFYTLQATATGAEGPLTFLATRFLTATFLHVIASGIFGYFVALTFFSFSKGVVWERLRVPKTHVFIFLGLALSTILHGLYNNFIIQEQGPFVWQGIPLIPIAILFGGGIFLLILYWHLRRLAK